AQRLGLGLSQRRSKANPGGVAVVRRIELIGDAAPAGVGQRRGGEERERDKSSNKQPQGPGQSTYTHHLRLQTPSTPTHDRSYPAFREHKPTLSNTDADRDHTRPELAWD